MLDRHDLTNEEWARLEPLLPDRTPGRGGRWVDHRLIINGVLWRTRTGAPWRDLPLCYGNWKTVYGRHRRWSGDGTWEVILDGLRAGCDEAEGAEWTAGIDATVVRAHQHAAGARHEPPKDIAPERLIPVLGERVSAPGRTGAGANDNNRPPAPSQRRDREALGRSRGGLTTKIHLLADRRCRPVARVTTAGQRHDSLAFEPLMNRLRIARAEPGRPRTRPGRLLGDKAYSNKKIRAHLRRRRITATIPEPADQIAHRVKRGVKGGRPPAFDAVAYKDRNTTERAFNKLKAFRAVAMRTDKRDYIYRGTVDIATIKIWLRDPVRKDP